MSLKQEVKNPMYSIITVCFNSISTIEKTFQSILKQKFLNYEYIVIDGASKDGTVKLLEEYEQKFSGKMYWLSEKDDGIYDAMNKGIDLSHGEYLLFINADDVLCDDVLENMAIKIGASKFDIYYGDSISEYEINGKKIRVYKRALGDINLSTLNLGMGVIHQCLITSRKIFFKVGKFNSEYKIGADWDLLIRSVKLNCSMCYIHQPICYFRRDGISAKPHNKERHKIRKHNNLYRYIDLYYFKDILSLSNVIKNILGQNNFERLQFKYNQIIRKGKVI